MSEIYSYPKSLKKLRACFSCHLIKTEEQFIEEGCENCGGKWNKTEAIQRITSNFKGIIAITNPKFSWCAKWLHKNNVIPGCYCIDIITDEIEEEEDEYENEDNY